MAATATPAHAAGRLCELSTDARAAVLLDAAGALAGASELDEAGAKALGELARELFAAVDAVPRPDGVDPPEQVEVQVDRGAVYASRTPRWTLAVVARRQALSSLMLYDLRSVLAELEGGPPIRRAAAAPASAAAPGDADAAAGSPMPELGTDK